MFGWRLKMRGREFGYLRSGIARGNSRGLATCSLLLLRLLDAKGGNGCQRAWAMDGVANVSKFLVAIDTTFCGRSAIGLPHGE